MEYRSESTGCWDEEGIWRIDYEDMEEKIVQNKIHAAVFCFAAQSDRTCLGALGD